jgi:hypothetical protein
VVVEDSREDDAYRIARQKLKLITKTLVEPERFESVFGRVMCLLSQDELQDILLNDSTAPFSPGDEMRLADMVQDGFWRWKRFHDQYGQQQKSIQRQNPGQATWADARQFLEQQADAKPREGYKIVRFRRDGENVTRVEEDAHVLAFPAGDSYVCADYSESLVYGPDGHLAPKLGLNIPVVAEALRRAGLPNQPSGAAWLRWPGVATLPNGISSLPFGVVAVVRETLRRDNNGQWSEIGPTLHLHVVQNGSAAELDGPGKGELVRNLLRSTIRKSGETKHPLSSVIGETEKQAITNLWKPTEEDLKAGIRHAVLPLFAAVVTD